VGLLCDYQNAFLAAGSHQLAAKIAIRLNYSDVHRVLAMLKMERAKWVSIHSWLSYWDSSIYFTDQWINLTDVACVAGSEDGTAVSLHKVMDLPEGEVLSGRSNE
jgi:hypothetical protein